MAYVHSLFLFLFPERTAYTERHEQVFWISYDDFLRHFEHLDRTRLFGPEWDIIQRWTALQVPWSSRYHSTMFAIEVKKTSPIVILLTQVRKLAQPQKIYSIDLQLTCRLPRLIQDTSKDWRESFAFTSNSGSKKKAKRATFYEAATPSWHQASMRK